MRARARHLPALSFDLIYARPGQTLTAWRDELEEAIGIAADHLSLYQLTIEEETPLRPLYARRQARDSGAGARGGFLSSSRRTSPPARASGLRDLQSRAARRREPPQPDLLALRRLRRRRPRRARPADRRRRAARHRHGAPPGDLAGEGRGGRPRPRHRRRAHAGGGGRRDAAHGPAAQRRHRPGALRADIRPQLSAPTASASSCRTVSSRRAETDGCGRRATAGSSSIRWSPTSPPEYPEAEPTRLRAN